MEQYWETIIHILCTVALFYRTFSIEMMKMGNWKDMNQGWGQIHLKSSPFRKYTKFQFPSIEDNLNFGVLPEWTKIQNGTDPNPDKNHVIVYMQLIYCT